MVILHWISESFYIFIFCSANLICFTNDCKLEKIFPLKCETFACIYFSAVNIVQQHKNVAVADQILRVPFCYNVTVNPLLYSYILVGLTLQTNKQTNKYRIEIFCAHTHVTYFLNIKRNIHSLFIDLIN